MAHIHIFSNNPTSGGVDGTEISGGDLSSPLAFALNANNSERKAQKVAVRCDAGYSIEGACEIYFDGDTASMWAVASDDNFSDSSLALTFANWNDSMTIGGVSSLNHIFWVRASSSSLEAPQNDTSVTLHADGLVVELDG